MSDHLVIPEGQSYPAPFLCDPLMSLAFAAGATDRVGLGTTVLVGPQYTSPLALANSLASLDYLSDGRFTLGIGIGWSEKEYEALHAPFDHRGERLDEMIDLFRTAWHDDPATHEGRWYSFTDIHVLPQPAHEIPIWIGGASDAAFARAFAKADGYHGIGVEPEQAARARRAHSRRPSRGRVHDLVARALGRAARSSPTRSRRSATPTKRPASSTSWPRRRAGASTRGSKGWRRSRTRSGSKPAERLPLRSPAMAIAVPADPRRPATILHTSDCHLAGYNGGREEPAFAKAIDFALREQVDAVLITGDLFDNARVPDSLLDWTVSELDRLALPVVMIPGNHDVFDEKSVHHRFTVSDRCANVQFIDSPEGRWWRSPVPTSWCGVGRCPSTSPTSARSSESRHGPRIVGRLRPVTGS